MAADIGFQELEGLGRELVLFEDQGNRTTNVDGAVCQRAVDIEDIDIKFRDAHAG